MLLLTALVIGCHRQPRLPTQLSSVRPPPPNSRTMELVVPREEYLARLRDPSMIGRMRVVPMTTRADESGGIPEYRLFGIREESPAYLLGLRNADILVSANDFIIYDPQKFKGYLVLLQNQTEAQIEIRRGGDPIIFQYTFQ